MKKYLPIICLGLSLSACHSDENVLAEPQLKVKDTLLAETSFSYVADQFSDLRLLRYKV